MERIFKGQISITSKKDGYVRVEPLEHEGAIFVDHSHLNTALHHDIVEVEHGHYFLVPHDKRMYTDILLPKEELMGAEIGMKVIAEIVEWKDPHKSPIGRVTYVLGKPGDNDAEMLAYALERGFSDEHKVEVTKEAESIKARGITEEDKAGRRDFRDTPTFTIDPVDAKDFDDALSFKKLESGRYEIGIHIADVSHYVKPDMALDDEAVARQTSVYLVDRVVRGPRATADAAR
jgi:ribonuclease R